MIPMQGLARLLPAGCAASVTAVLINHLEPAEYGRFSVMLAQVGLLNSVLFHWTRHLITFATLYALDGNTLTRSWLWSAGGAVGIAVITAATGFAAVQVAIVQLAYLLLQSAFEQRLTHARAATDGRAYLRTACVRPVLSLLLIALLIQRDPSPTAMKVFIVVTITAGLACLPGRRPPWSWHRPCHGTGHAHVWRAARLAARILPGLGYVFIVDAVTRMVLETRMTAEQFGRYSALADVSLPLCWVASSALTWGFIARLLALSYHERMAYANAVIRRSLAAPVVLALIALALPRDFRPAGVDTTTALLLMASHAISASLSCVVFPMVIALHREWRACACASLGLALVSLTLVVLPLSPALDIVAAVQLGAHLPTLAAALLAGMGGPSR